MIFFKLTLNTKPRIEMISSGLSDEEIMLKWMVTFYSRGPRRQGTLEHSNFKFGLDKTFSILSESAEVGSFRSPLLIAFALGFVEAEVLVQNYSIAKEVEHKRDSFIFLQEHHGKPLQNGGLKDAKFCLLRAAER